LLTLRAVECLSRADLVLYDQLVPLQLLDHAPPAARRVCVSELHPCHPKRSPLINQALIDAARQGLRVVRLKGGDPFLFGRGGEEAEALHQAGIPFEVVPGVTAALGAAGCAGIPLTHRGEASAVAFVTGHEAPPPHGGGSPAIDWSALAHFPGTLVIYMGLVRLPRIAESLIEQGKNPATPAAAIHLGSTSCQRTVTAPLAELPAAAAAAGLQSPTLIVIGPVVAFRDRLAWFENRPLFGKHVLVTRPRDQAGELVRPLEELGATVSVLPLVEIRGLADFSALDAALDRLARYRWLVFTSANGVHAFLRRLRQRGKDLRALGGISLAVIGPATADALRSYHLEPDLVPEEYRSESLAAALRERVRGQRILLARADRGREVLREQLAEVAEVEQVAVYSQVDAGEGDPLGAKPGIREQLRSGEIEFVTLTSSNIATALLKHLDDATRCGIEQGRVRLVSISPVTSAAIRGFGLPVAAEATEYTTAGVIQALQDLVTKRGSAEILQGIPGQVAHDTAGDDPEDVHQPVDSTEGNSQDQVQQEQQQEQAGNPHGAPAQPFFHEQTFQHLTRTAFSEIGLAPVHSYLLSGNPFPDASHCSGSVNARHAASTGNSSWAAPNRGIFATDSSFRPFPSFLCQDRFPPFEPTPCCEGWLTDPSPLRGAGVGLFGLH